MKRAIIEELFPITNGLFSQIDYTFWDFTSDQLDIQLISRCGNRFSAPIIKYIKTDSTDRKLNIQELQALGSIILKTYKPKWDRLSELHLLEYDVLKNYVDEYSEVSQDDDSTEESKISNRAERAYEASKLASSTGSNATQSASNTNETESTRIDAFTSEFTRASSDSTTRTDNLTETKNENEDTDSTRTDNLNDSKTYSGSDSTTHQGGNFTETTTRQLSTSGTQSGSNSVYGFNSATSVGDSEVDNTTSGTENETVGKVYTGTKTDSLSKSGTDSTDHTGTQRNVINLDKDSTKTNTGTQTISETISVTDNTSNNDNQTNTTTSEGSSSTTNESSQQAVSSSDMQTGNTSQLDENSVISRALNRARRYSHKGNIGNFTPQQLIKQEIELWRWNFIDEVLNDVKDLISIPIY